MSVHRIPGVPVILPERFDQDLEGAVLASGIPEHMHEGVIAYLRYGRPCGSFLEAVISNDLAEAVRKGDHHNQRALAAYIILFAIAAPIGTWGSPEAYANWINRGHEARHAARAAESE